jgi:hypothetical protein
MSASPILLCVSYSDVGGTMSTSLKFALASIAGAAVAAVTAVIVTLFASLTGYNLFSFSLFFIVPVGAIATGAAAASGYYFACKQLQLRPGILMLAQMVLVAAATNVLIYYFEYLTLVWGDPVAFNLDVFGAYLNEYFAHQQLAMGRGLWSVGEVGKYGYMFAALYFAGFLIGAGLIVAALLMTPACKTCSLYYQTHARRKRFFHSEGHAAAYSVGLFSLPLDGPEFAARTELGDDKLRPALGQVCVKSTLLNCPSCKQQVWQDVSEQWDGQNWRSLERFKRSFLVPKGLDVTALFQKHRDAVKQSGVEPG